MILYPQNQQTSVTGHENSILDKVNFAQNGSRQGHGNQPQKLAPPLLHSSRQTT